MRLNKKLAATAMAALMASSVLAGCGDNATNATNANNGQTQGSNNGETQAENSGNSEYPTITFMAVDHSGHALSNEHSDEVIAKMTEYTETNVQFQWEANDTYKEKFGVVLMDKDNMPMILTSPDSEVKGSVIDAARKDAFWDLAPFLEDEEAYPNLAQIKDEVKDGLTVDGKLIGLPRSRPIGRNGMVYRTDWAEKVGITEAPKTVDDVYNMLYKFAKEDPDGNGKDDTYGMEMCKYTGPLDIIQTWFGCGNGWVEQDGQLVPVHQTAEYMEALNWMKKIYDEGLIRKDWAAVDTTEWGNGIKKGEVGVFVDVLDTGKRAWDYYEDNDVKSVVNPEETATITYVGPVAKDENSEPRTQATSGIAGLFMITKDGAKTEEDVKNCLHFLDKMNDNEMLVLADYGLEGITYEINDEGKIELLDTGLDAAQTPNSGLNQTLCYVPNAASTDPVLVKDEQTQLLQDYQKMNEEYAVFNPATKYLLNSDANAKNGDTLKQILDDARTQYICGAIDENGLKAQWEDWARRGGEDLIKEVNEQYQADQNK